MATRDFFSDEFTDIQSIASNDNLFPFIDLKNDKETLDWLNRDIGDKMQRAEPRLERIRQLRSLFKGINYTSNDERTSRDTLGLGSTKPRNAKMFVNFINEMVEAKVAQRSRFKPSIVVLPNNDDVKDKNNAQTCKQLLDCKSQELDFEGIFSNADKILFLSGESYSFVLWDKQAGGFNKKAEVFNKKIMNGDVKILLLGPERAFLQLDKNDFSECDDISYIEYVHIDELKALYPKKEKDIKVNSEEVCFDSSDMTKRNLKNHCMVVNYFHKVTRFLPEGIRIRYIKSCILENEPLTVLYGHGKLPVVFDTDIDLDGEIHGRPFTDNISRLQAVHNMVMASMAGGFSKACSPKWVAPEGSIAINKLSNEYSLLSYKGAVPPQLVTYSGIPKDSWEYSKVLENFVQKGASVYGISRGEPPKGIKAAVALQFLDEQELQRESRGMAKRQRRILDVYKLVLDEMSQHYTKEDGRIFKMLGSDNSYLINTFDLEGVSNFDIRLQNTSSLSDSKTGKIAAILDINTATQADPYFGKEEISSILDMGNDQRFRDKMAVSVKAADAVIQKIMNGEQGLAPRDWDDFVVQYPIFLRALQERSYKDEEQGLVVELTEYITAMEYLMYNKSMASPAFKMRIDLFYMFPVFFKIPLGIVPPMAGPIELPNAAAGADAKTGRMQQNIDNQLKQQQQQESPQ